MARKARVPRAQEDVRTSIVLPVELHEQLAAYALWNRTTKNDAIVKALTSLCAGYHIRGPSAPRNGSQASSDASAENAA